MSSPHAAAQSDPGDARIADEHRITDPPDDDEIDAPDTRARRWYHLRPQPRRRADLMGINSTWWMAVGWLAVILLIVFPFPWW
jgi:hypothetical protein